MALPLLRLLAAGAAVWAASATRSVGSSLSLHPTPAICRVRCRTEQSCTDWPATCLDCPVCEDFRKQPDVAPEECPSYCINAKWCILMSSVCTPQRCPHICADETGAAPVVPAEMRPLNELMLELEGLVGLGQVKSQMKELIAQVDFNLQRSKLSLPDIGGQSLHMAFLGNPGTGKTVVARIVGELLVTMGAIKRPTDGTSGPASIVKEVSRADLVGEHVGSTALKVSKAFEEAMGGVLFIDEAYSIVQGDRDSFGKEAVDTIIKLMEDHRDQIIVILAGYQKEMADFIAANPGFKSRVAFNFNFPDYTCPELVDIAERLMKSKNVGLSATRADVCQGPDAPSACEWLKSAIRFRTGCCEAADCGKKENRANGNGRTVRNVLEASYREMASRVLTTFTPGLLQDYDSAKRPAVRGRGKEATPEPALHCGRRFERLRAGGPYSSMQDVGDADVRCAFRLLDESDLRSSTAASLGEQLQANCQTTKTPVTVNVSSTLETLSPASLDWDRLHQGLYHERECSRVQALLSSGSLLQLSAVPSSHSDSEDERCKYCTNEGMCTMRRSICEGCASCQRFTQDTEAEGLATSEAQCKVCGWVKRKYRNTPAMELPLLMDSRNICSIYNRAHPAEGVSSSHCRRAVSRTLTQLSGGVRKFTCSSVLSLECPEDQENAVRDAGGVGAMLRPGSKVDDLMKELQELIGLQSVKSGISALRDSVEFDMWRRKFLGEHWSLLGQSFHMRFLGNPGTGKTVVARIVGKILVELGVVKHEDADEGFVFKEVSRADLVGGYVGHTAPKVQAAVKSAFGGVLFIDEAYSLIQGERDSFGQEAVDTLIKEIEDHRDKVIVILAGYHKEMEKFFDSNPGFQSRVPFRFDFADYSCEELARMSTLSLTKQNVTPTSEAETWLSKMVVAKTGCCAQADLDAGRCGGAARDNGNGRAVRNILESSLRAMSVRAVSSPFSKQMVTELRDSDVAAVGGELLGEALRGTCKMSQAPVPDLELLTGPLMLALNFDEVMELAQTDCKAASRMVLRARPKPGIVASAADIEIRDPDLQKVFGELDELIGLASVKRAMREFYATVEFANLRKRAGLEPLKSQSFHMRFVGNPGTGKTVVARIVGKLLVALGAIEKPPKEEELNDPVEDPDAGPVFNEVSRSDLVAEYVGQTAKKVMDQVEKSLGGVLFLDEAYALVQGDRDTFGQEAVDTLIKEMEDKRANFIVICAGYEEEMDEFFNSNPGFKSRVPFTFHFEDYTCSELDDIGKLGLRKKELKLPESTDTYQQALRFSTGCCDKLEDCVADRAKGNGRAVRNTLEAATRAMATRLQGSEEVSAEIYSQLTPADFAAVTAQAVQSHLAVPCGKNGELAQILDMMNQSVGFSSKMSGKPSDLVARLKSIVTETNAVNSMRDADPETQRLGAQCEEEVTRVLKTVYRSMHSYCRSSGTLDFLSDKIRAGKTQSDVEAASKLLEDGSSDLELMKALMQCFSENRKVQQMAQHCDAKLEDIRSTEYSMPFHVSA